MINHTLILERSTKNTHVFKAPKGFPVDTLYIQKDAFPAGHTPKEIRITIEETASALA